MGWAVVFVLFFFCPEINSQTFPYPIHFDLPESHLSRVSKYDHFPKDPPSGTHFRVAVMTAGSIRSFGFVEKSWKRYLLDPWKKHIFLFAHAIGLPHCAISKIGVELLHELCTEYEISYSQAALLPYHEVVRRIPGHYLRFKEYMAQFGPTMERGNYFDMHARRHRVYEMAMNHALRHDFQWDLMIFLRLDLAFYAPRLELFQWHQFLVERNSSTSSQDSSSSGGIIIPHSCNFHGVCDRIAIGLPQQMALYFEKDLVFKVLDWSLELVPETHDLYYPKSYMRSNGNSEHLLECWFLMSNLTQFIFPKPQPIVFVTVRSAHASAYCRLSRDDYVQRYPAEAFIFDPDKTTANGDLTRQAGEFDLIANSEQRCGAKMSHVNSTLACLHSACRCGVWGRR
jgi:hypothetical protein